MQAVWSLHAVVVPCAPGATAGAEVAQSAPQNIPHDRHFYTSSLELCHCMVKKGAVAVSVVTSLF